MTLGIWLKKDWKATNPQKLWDTGIRFIYTDLTNNGALSDTANVCAYYGFKMGLYHRLRYPTEIGSADSQAQEFMVAQNTLMNFKEYKDVIFLPPVLHLAKGDPVLCETNMYRGMVMTFLQKYHSYHGVSLTFLLRMTTDMITWMKPTQQIVDSFGLWYHEPTTKMNYAPWTKYVYRSYAARSMAGIMAEPVDDVLIPITPPTPVTPPVPVLTDAEKIAQAKVLVQQLSKLLE